MNELVLLAQIFLGAIAGVVATVLFQERIERGIVALLGRDWSGRRRTRGVEGYWYSVFWYRGVDQKVHRVATVVRIRRIGKRVALKTELGGAASYQVVGSISLGRFITAVWANDTDSSAYKGACQFARLPEGDVLAGSWIGWNKSQHVSMGPWVMVQIGQKRDQVTFAKLLSADSFELQETDELAGPITSPVTQKVKETVTWYAKTYRDADWSDARWNIRSDSA